MTLATPSRAVQMQRRFVEIFGAAPALRVQAPGRVNLIGEHTDYNEGFVLPAAIDRAAYVVARTRTDRLLHVHAEQYGHLATIPLDALHPGIATGWSAFVAGMADHLQQAGHALVGGDLLIDGDVPQGAGLSSSAALEVAIGAALLALADLPVDRVQLALTGQRTEHTYINVMSGIMDQLISALGQRNHALLIDCRDLSTQPIPLRSDVAIVVCNSKLRRELAASGYNARRAECDAAVQRLQTVLPAIHTLRDVSTEQLEAHRALLDDTVYRRARHVVTENARVLASGEALQRGDIQQFGALMNDAHRSYRDDFEASLPQIEVLVSTAQAIPGVYGSRLTGGGWGGCTVSLVKPDVVDQFVSTVSSAYEHDVGIAPDIYVCAASDGVAVTPISDPGA